MFIMIKTKRKNRKEYQGCPTNAVGDLKLVYGLFNFLMFGTTKVVALSAYSVNVSVFANSVIERRGTNL